METDSELDTERELWASFLVSRAADERTALVERYTPFACAMAGKYYAGRHVYEIEFEEFRQYALLGLIESIDRFDPARGVNFRSYAGHRISGAILNGIEKYCERQQQIATRARLRAERFSALSNEASDAQPDPFARLVDIAIGVAIGYMLEDSGMYRNEKESYEHNVYKNRELEDVKRQLHGLIDVLPEQERSVLRYHYLQHMQFEEIAKLMELSKGRISQIHRSALQNMRTLHQQQRIQRSDY